MGCLVILISGNWAFFADREMPKLLPGSWLVLIRQHLKAAKYEIRKPSTCPATLFRCKCLSMFPVFHLTRSTWPATKTFVAGWRKVLRKVERWSTLSNRFWLCCSFFIKLTTCHATNAAILDPRQANQPISALHFFNPQQMQNLALKWRRYHVFPAKMTQVCARSVLLYEKISYLQSFSFRPRI